MPLKSPLSVQLEITDKCNNLCEYCYNYWRWDEIDSEEMNNEDFKNIIDKVSESDVWYLNITGGEPLIEKDKTIDIINHATQKDIITSMNSNLSLMDIDTVYELKDAGLNSILGSIAHSNEYIHDKITNKKGSFRDTLKGIENILKAGIPLSVNMTTFKKNFDDVYNVGELLSNKGVKRYALSRFIPSLSNPDHVNLRLDNKEINTVVDQALKVEKELGMGIHFILPIPYCIFPEDHEIFRRNDLLMSCAAGKSTSAISSSGKVRPCIHMDLEYGDLKNESLDDIFSRMIDFKENEYYPEECNFCEEIHNCKTGCRADQYSDGEQLNKVDSLYKKPLKKKVVSSKEKGDLSKNVILKVPKYRKRKENFGWLVSTGLTQTIPTNEEGLKILDFLNKNDDITYGELLSVFDKDKKDYIKDFIEKAYNLGVIREY